MTYNKKSVEDIDVKGKRVLVRCDFNVPLKNGEITDDTRIVAALPTIKKLIGDGGKVILCSHLGKVKNGPNEGESLAPVAKRLSEKLGKEVTFVADYNVTGEAATKAVENMKEGDVVLLQNTRFRGAEETKNGEEFSKELADLADLYVCDAFGSSHRAHASVAGVTKFISAKGGSNVVGYLMEKEVKAIENVLQNAQHPFTAIIGGSKVSSKLGVIKNLLDKVDNLIIGGGMGYTFIKAQGGHIGKSLHEDELMPDALQIMKEAKEKGVNLSLSVATVSGQEFSNDTPRKTFDIFNIPDDWEGMDASEASLENWKKIILASKTILWNGPVGVFELPNFAHGTEKIAEFVAEATQNGAYSLVGGGDSVAAVTKLGFADKVSYVSTGGGAMLEAIEGKDLPGIAAIRE